MQLWTLPNSLTLTELLYIGNIAYLPSACFMILYYVLIIIELYHSQTVTLFNSPILTILAYLLTGLNVVSKPVLL